MAHWHTSCKHTSLSGSTLKQRGVNMKGDIGTDRRHLERFSVKAFAVVQTLSPGTEKVFELDTQDISSGGAFFPMEVPLPAGEKVKITLYLSISGVEKLTDFPAKTKIETKGEVVRSTNNGVAVAFGKHYTMSPATM
jgi:PilZ domain